MIKIAFVITGLSRGGAERMLIKLLSLMDRTKFSPVVFCLTTHLSFKPDIDALGIPVFSYRLNKPLFMLFDFVKFIRDSRKLRPDILQGWMYHGNILAWAASLFTPSKLIFGIRVALYDFNFERLRTRLIIRLGALLSRFADKIIYVSEVARHHHEAIGYKAENACVLANGFELDKFQPNESYRHDYRSRLGAHESDFLIGYFARFHKMKGHLDLLEAFAAVYRRYPKVKLALAGLHLDESNTEIQSGLSQLKISKHVLLLGQLSNPERVLPALDLFVSPSHQEGFPNVVGEAMACQIPCVVTDVGDSALCVGDTGIVVPSMRPDLLADGIIQMINNPDRQDLGLKARQRIETEFALSDIVKKYEQVYTSIMMETL